MIISDVDDMPLRQMYKSNLNNLNTQKVYHVVLGLKLMLHIQNFCFW